MKMMTQLVEVFLALALSLVTFGVRVGVEHIVAGLLIPSRHRAPRRLRAILFANLFTHPIMCLCFYLAMHGNWTVLLATPLVELAFVGVKGVFLGVATKESLKSVYTSCFAAIASCVAALGTCYLTAILL